MSSAPPDDDRTVLRPLASDTAASSAADMAPTQINPPPVPTEPPPLASHDNEATIMASPADAPTLAAPGLAPTAVQPRPAPAEHGNALPLGTRLGEFELLGMLGEGGFGIVYVAQDHSLQRRVALKEYMPASLASRNEGSQVQVRSERYRETFEIGLRSFINEARLLAQFDHPSLVKVYRFWEANGTAYMVMPLYEGVTLKDKLRRMDQAPDERWLMTMLAPLTEALSVIHAESCYHRDIAPDNIILLAGSERPLLLDFGAARRVISDMTQALTVILKPGYAPVEQYAEVKEMKQGPWTDVYALAATVHFAITGRTPPPSVGRLMGDSFQPVSETAAGRYSDTFLQAIDHGLQVRPTDRTQTIAEFRAELGLHPADDGRTVQMLPAAQPAGAAATSAAPWQATRAATRVGEPDAATVVRPAAMAAPSAAAAAAPAASIETAPAAPRRPVGLIGAALAGLVLLGGGAWWWSSQPSQPAPVPPTQSAPAPLPGPAVAATPAPAPATPASAAPAPTSPVLSAAPPFEIRSEFGKVLAGQTAGFDVKAVPTKPTLRIGADKLGFTVTSSRAGFVQVLVLGPDGSLMLLFPNAQASNNAIKAGQTLSLPQSSWPLDTVEPAGQEDFLVVVSAHPRDYSELSKERDYIFLKLPTGKKGADLAAGWTRSTPLLLGGLKSCPNADCEAYGASSFSVNIVH